MTHHLFAAAEDILQTGNFVEHRLIEVAGDGSTMLGQDGHRATYESALLFCQGL
jgi:hypothetical protein